MPVIKSQRAKFMRLLRQEVRAGVEAAGRILKIAVQEKLTQQASNRGATPSPPGSPPAKGTGALGRSIRMDLSGLSDASNPSVRVGTSLVYARIHEFGGVIRGKKVKYLPVPLNAEARKLLRTVGQGGLRTIPGLFVVRSKTGKLLLGRRAKKSGRGSRKERGRGFIALFVLKPEVRLPPRPYFRPALAESRERMVNAIQGAVGRATKRLGAL